MYHNEHITKLEDEALIAKNAKTLLNISYWLWTQQGHVPENDHQESQYSKPNITRVNVNFLFHHFMASPGLEPETFSVLD